MDSDAEDFLQGLAAGGIKPDRLKAILLTHWHNDHSAGAAFLQRKFGARVFYAAAETPCLTRETATKGIRGWLGKNVPEAGVLVLLRGLLEEAAPEAVTANHLVIGGEIVEGGFRAVATPGHTLGHVAYVHGPSRTLCGDALAVVDDRLRLMAKPVTPDLPAARSSALQCLREDVDIICPGHRAPLTQNVRQERRRLQAYLEAGGRWPLLGYSENRARRIIVGRRGGLMRILAIGLVAILAAGAGWGQIRGGGGGSIGGGAATSGGISGRNTTSTNPNDTGIGDNSSLNQRPLYFSGKVVLSDGAALPEPAKIERSCGEAIRVQAYTDLKGRFSFQTGQNTELPDVSDRTGASGGTFGVPSRTRDRSQFDCELHITLPGFRPETISLANVRYMDNPDLGTIILRRIAKVDGLTVSATSSLAPKDAKKAYEKGQEALNKKNMTEAQKDFEKAGEIYPRYAAAWYELGRLDEQKNQFDEARKDYGQAVTADAKYIPPYERLAWIALRETKWQEVADDAETILRLDPVDYPDAYYLSGVANLQLGNLDAAEKNAREAVERDTTHKNARASYVLGLILAQKHDFAGAVPLLRAFLEQNPDVADAATVRQQLAAIEQAAKGNTSSSQEKPVQDQ